MELRGTQLHRKRCKRWDIPCDVHYLTFSCFKQQPFFQSRRACQWFLDALNAARLRRPFDLWAYVIMPEHVHVVLWPHEGTLIREILKSIKLSVARKAVIWVRREAPGFLPRMEDRQPNGRSSYRFWQRGGGYDRNLRSDTDVHEKIEYVHENPVRRGLVERAQDWPWSSCRAHHECLDEPLAIDRDSMPTVVG